MISVEMYLMGRDKDFPLDMLQTRNMAELLSRVNWLLGILNKKTFVTSGYRPSAINKTIGGAKMSTHTMCAGIDLHDPDNSIGKFLKNNIRFLEEVNLYLENPDFTKGWAHLQTRKTKSGNRVFNP